MRSSRREPREPREGKGWTFWGSVAVLAALLLTLGYVLFWPTPSPTSADSPQTPAPHTAVLPADTPCAGQAPSAATSQVYWSRLDTMTVPSSQAGGPWNYSNGFSVCYARSPLGAVTSLSWFIAELTATSSAKQGDLIQARVAHEGSYELLLQRVSAQAASTQSDGQSRNGDVLRQFAAYRIASYTPDRAVIELVYRLAAGERAGNMASGTYVMSWTDNDWKIVYTGLTTSYRNISDLNGFQTWGGA